MIETEMSEIGYKFRENSRLLTNRLIESGTLAKTICKECQLNIIDKFFECLGDALGREDAEALDQIAQWAIYSRYRYAQIHLRNQPCHFPNHEFHDVLLDFIETEIIKNGLTPSQTIKLVKKINFYINHAGTLFTSESNHKLLNDLHDRGLLTDSERITLHELTALKNALKEATILAITDKNDRISYANEQFCNITKYSIEELIGRSHDELLFSGYHSSEFFEEIRDFIKDGKVWNGEICNKAKDGSLYWVDTTIVPFLDNKGVPYEHISIMFDITEKKNTEDMLHKTEKLSLVGELAAGFAHEIRNPLTTIRGFVQIMDSFSDEKRKYYSQTVLDEIDRINTIVSEFMVFAKPHAVHFSQCSLSQIIKNVIHFLQSEAIMKNVEITHSFTDEDIYLHGEKHQLTQVFINIVKNAMDAVPNGGKVILSNTFRDNEICILIEDNGIGMTQDQIDKIGQPFYTTKKKGNGLGLMVSYKIIANHRGRITVTSEPYKGTTFMIIFPKPGIS